MSQCKVINAEHRTSLRNINEEWRNATLLDENFERVYSQMKPLDMVSPDAIMSMYQYRK